MSPLERLLCVVGSGGLTPPRREKNVKAKTFKPNHGFVHILRNVFELYPVVCFDNRNARADIKSTGNSDFEVCCIVCSRLTVALDRK